MSIEDALKGAHERRLADVRRLTSPTGHPPYSGGVVQLPESEAEERLRVAMIKLLPRAVASDDACVRLLGAVEEMWSMASHDVRALDAWHNAYEAAVERGLDPASSEFGAFLSRYAALLEEWIATSS